MKHRRLFFYLVGTILVMIFVVSFAKSTRSGSAKAATTLQVNDLRINLMKQPLSVAKENLQFSWAIQAAQNDVKQTAYRIVIGHNQTDVLKAQNLVIDSGWHDASKSSDVHLKQAAQKLADNELYYWSVQVKDNYGQVSALQTAQAFTTTPKWQSTQAIWNDPKQVPATDFWADHGWQNYAIDLQVKTASALGIVFRAQNQKQYLMWQIRTDHNELRPHIATDGTPKLLDNQAISLNQVKLPTDAYFQIRLVIPGQTVKTYIKLPQAAAYQLVNTKNLATDLTAGSVGFRTGRSETADVKDLKITSLDNNQVLYQNDFQKATSDFPGTKVNAGSLNIPNNVSTPSLLTTQVIDPQEGLKGSLSAQDHYVFMRKSFNVDDPKRIDHAILNVTARSGTKSRQFVSKLSLNGQFVGVSPTRKSKDSTSMFYNTFDVTKQLRSGENVLGALNYATEDQGFLAQLTFYYKDGTQQVVTNSGLANAGWLVKDGTNALGDDGTSLGTQYYQVAAQNINNLDFPSGWDAPGYQANETTGWVQPHKVGEITTDKNKLTAYPVDNMAQFEITPAKVTAEGEGHYLIDLGKEIVGGLALKGINADQPGQMKVRYGEELENGAVKWQMRTGNHYQETWTYRTGTQDFVTSDLMTYRYIEVTGSPTQLTKDNVRGLALRQAFDNSAASFASSDQRLNQIYEFTKYTVQATNQDLMVDSQSRERGAYEGDVLINALSSYAVSNDYALARFSNEWLTTQRTWPAEYVLYTVMSAWNDYQYTGNKSELKQYYDLIKANGDQLYTGSIDQNGLVKNGLHNNGWNSVLVD
ncbi:family 78 glycoside hydrolase catalytic domain [Lactobacillus sp. CC-MHH1034]|nr:family 78 glycoside hydrolase catalytic domain [Agrilactobacillus fermenti]